MCDFWWGYVLGVWVFGVMGCAALVLFDSVVLLE